MTSADASVYDETALEAYDLVASTLSPGAGLVGWLLNHRKLDGQMVLDLGAGTGVSSLALADAGAEVVAVDASRTSLGMLEGKRADRTVSTVEADFRSLDLSTLFDVIVMSRNTFFLAQTHQDKIDLMCAMRKHLKPSGAVFLDCTEPTEFMLNNGDAATTTYPLGRDNIVTFTQTADRSSQQVLSIIMVQSASTLTAFHEMATWATLAEIRLIAGIAGLKIARVDGSYGGEEYGSRSREMLVVLECE